MSDIFSAHLIPYQVALTAVLLVVGLNLIANLRMVEKATPSQVNPTGLEWVSVLVPARNEARNIRRCLESLLAQDYPLMEVLVLDDGSTDETPEIVAEMARRDPRLRLIPGQPLPAGWMGKNFACHQLAQEARGQWLLFTDADTVHHPQAVSWALTAAKENRADLVTLVPHAVTHTFGEQLLLPIIPFGILGLFPLALGARLRIPALTMAIGTFLLFRRETYERIGGHAAVRGRSRRTWCWPVGSGGTADGWSCWTAPTTWTSTSIGGSGSRGTGWQRVPSPLWSTICR